MTQLKPPKIIKSTVKSKPKKMKLSNNPHRRKDLFLLTNKERKDLKLREILEQVQENKTQ
jgi:hypothetical protein